MYTSALALNFESFEPQKHNSMDAHFNLCLTSMIILEIQNFFTLLIFLQLINNVVQSAPATVQARLENQNDGHPFVGFFVFPHGGITLNPHTHDFSGDGGARDGSRQEAIGLHEAMASAAKDLMQSKPDVIILSTPHGYYLDKSFVFVGNPKMTGNAGWEWSNFSAAFNIARDETINLYLDMLKQNNPVNLLSFGIGQTTMSLQWGEVIPWNFIQDAASELGVPLPSVIYLGQPPTKNIAALQKFGKDLATHVKSSPSLKYQRVAMLVSGDLSHYHSNDTKAPYPFNPNSAVFDAQIQAWGRTDRTPETERNSSEFLLQKAESVSNSAGSCGYHGLVMMHSAISNLVEDGSGARFRAKFYEYAAPTYFGMIVTSWVPME